MKILKNFRNTNIMLVMYKKLFQNIIFIQTLNSILYNINNK